MKTLYLLRHAKAIRPPGMDDFDRPLSEKGYTDAHLVSQHLAELKVPFDTIVSSPGIRALTTAFIFAKRLNFNLDNILIRSQLYDSEWKDYIACISDLGKSETVLLAGHNNAISDLAEKLSDGQVNDLKTCAVVGFSFKMDSWKNIKDVIGNVIFEVEPALLG